MLLHSANFPNVWINKSPLSLNNLNFLYMQETSENPHIFDLAGSSHGSSWTIWDTNCHRYIQIFGLFEDSLKNHSDPLHVRHLCTCRVWWAQLQPLIYRASAVIKRWSGDQVHQQNAKFRNSRWQLTHQLLWTSHSSSGCFRWQIFHRGRQRRSLPRCCCRGTKTKTIDTFCALRYRWVVAPGQV